MPQDTNMGVGVVSTGREMVVAILVVVMFVVVIVIVVARDVVVTLGVDMGTVVVIVLDSGVVVDVDIVGAGVVPCSGTVVGAGVEVDDVVALSTKCFKNSRSSML
jgi:hypothetical protein